MTLTIHGWMWPALITVGEFITASVWTAAEPPHGAYSFAIRPFIALARWLPASIVAWLVWALVR